MFWRPNLETQRKEQAVVPFQILLRIKVQNTMQILWLVKLNITTSVASTKNVLISHQRKLLNSYVRLCCLYLNEVFYNLQKALKRYFEYSKQSNVIVCAYYYYPFFRYNSTIHFFTAYYYCFCMLCIGYLFSVNDIIPFFLTCFKIFILRILEKDAFHLKCVLYYLVASVELNRPNDIYVMADSLVKNYPNK